MARGDRVVHVVGALRASDDVLEPDANVVARVDAHDVLGRCAGRAAGEGAAGHILHRIVGGGHAESGEGGLFYAVDGKFLGAGGLVVNFALGK